MRGVLWSRDMNIYWYIIIKNGCGTDEEADNEVVWECAKGEVECE